MLDLLLGMLMGAMGSLLLWITVGRRMMLRYAGESVLNAFKTPSPELKAAIASLSGQIWTWLNTPSLEVDGKDGDGKDIRVKISPMQQVLGILISETSGKMLAKITGMKGAATREMKKAEEELAVQLGMPRPGQNMMEYVAEQLTRQLLPHFKSKAEEIINGAVTNKGQSVSESGGSQGRY